MCKCELRIAMRRERQEETECGVGVCEGIRRAVSQRSLARERDEKRCKVLGSGGECSDRHAQTDMRGRLPAAVHA